MDLADFLCDIFAVSDLAKVNDIDTVFDVQEACLNYNRLFAHKRFKACIVFVHMFKATFGFMPSHRFVEEALQGMQAIDIQLINEFMCKHTFLRYARPETHLSKAYERSKFNVSTMLRAMDENNQYAKSLAWEWLSRDLQEQPQQLKNMSLFTGFIDSLKSRRQNLHVNVAELPLLSSDILDWKNIVLQCPYAYDAYAYHMTLNMNFMRSVFGRVLVFIDEDVLISHATSLVAAIAAHYHKDRLVVVHSQGVKVTLPNVNFTQINPRFIPSNCAAIAFHITKSTESKLDLGMTPVKQIIVASSQIFLSKEQASTVALGITEREDAKKMVNAVLTTHAACIPLFCPQPLINAYFQMFVDLINPQNKVNEMVIGRITVYNSLIPRIPESVVHLGNKEATKALVLIDTRANPLSLLSVFVSWANLRSPQEWKIVIGTCEENRKYYSKYLPNVHFFDSPELQCNPFDIEAYNNLLKSTAVWDYLKSIGVKKCLIIQDDGVLARPGVEAWFNEPFTYVGAPWLPCSANAEVESLTNKRMVGNGGVCMRDVADMHDIATRYSKEGRTLFNTRLQQIQEDVYYAKFASTPILEEAALFSMEQVYSPNALCFHKPWAYHPLSRLLDLARSICE